MCFLGSGRLPAADVGGCTEADFDAAMAMGGIVTFTQDCSITLTAPITVSANTTLDGQGYKVSISGGGQVFLFDVQARFTAIGLTFSGGQNTNGGAFYVHSGSFLVLTNCTVIGNKASGTNGVDGIAGVKGASGNGSNGTGGTAGSAGLGGAFYNLGTLVLQNCSIATNSATGGTGGVGGKGGDATFNAGHGGTGGAGGTAVGGAVYSTGALIISNCNVLGNSVKAGSGGIGGAAGSGTFGGRPGAGGTGAPASGAGVFSSGPVTVVNSTFAYNTAQGGDSQTGGLQENGNGTSGAKGGDVFGGGIYLGGGSVTNSTFYNNIITGGAGGNGGDGRLNAGNGGNGGNATGGGFYNTGGVTVVNCTFANCGAKGGTNGVGGKGLAGIDGTVGASRGGDLANGTGILTLRNSILSTNLAGQNAYGTITDDGYNISSDSTPSVFAGSSRKKLDPKIGTLANNGGPTLTIALMTNSPAVDVLGTNNPTVPRTDQRGILRAQGKGSDIGAFELVTRPAILIQPQSQPLTNGGSATLTVTAVGNGLKYQWLFEGDPIAKAINSSYTFYNADFTNAGNYAVVVSNIFGAVTSSNAVLSMIPYITGQPTNAEVALGDTTNFMVTAVGSGNFNYQWFFNATNLLSGATNLSYYVRNVQTNNAGAYNVVVSNSFGSVTSALATLIVDYPPAITSQPSNQTVSVGGFVRFVVQAIGTAPLNFQWRHYGTNLANAVSASYVNASAQPGDEGPYDVVIYNNVGQTNSAVVTLTLLQPPTITFQPQSLVVSAGQNAVFNVTATGAPLQYQWSYNGLEVAGATNASYTVVAAQPTNAGTYRVVVKNSFGSVTSSDASLSVNSPPVISVQPASQTVAIDSEVVFSVSASGTAPLSYQWRFNGVVTGSGPNYKFPAQKSDAGTYDVLISNGFGTVRSEPAVLTVLSTIKIVSVDAENGQIGFTFQSEAHSNYRVMRREALGAGDWTDYGDVIVGNGGLITVRDSATNAHSYYRVMAE